MTLVEHGLLSYPHPLPLPSPVFQTDRPAPIEGSNDNLTTESGDFAKSLDSSTSLPVPTSIDHQLDEAGGQDVRPQQTSLSQWNNIEKASQSYQNRPRTTADDASQNRSAGTETSTKLVKKPSKHKDFAELLAQAILEGTRIFQNDLDTQESWMCDPHTSIPHRGSARLEELYLEHGKLSKRNLQHSRRSEFIQYFIRLATKKRAANGGATSVCSRRSSWRQGLLGSIVIGLINHLSKQLSKPHKSKAYNIFVALIGKSPRTLLLLVLTLTSST